jgi:myosin heavy subunit
MDQLDAILDATQTATQQAASGDLMDDFVSGLTTTEEAPPAATEEAPPAATEDAPPAATEEAPETTEENVPEAPKNRKDWDVLRGSRDRWKTEAEEIKTVLSTKDETIKTLQQQLEELKNQTARLPELEDKLKDFDTYEKELAVTRLESTREYRETIAKPLEAIGNAAETLAQANETDTETILDVMREADPAKQREMFKEATLGWDEIDKSELWSAVKDARVLLDKQDLMRNNAAAAAREQLEKANAREQLEREEFKRAFVGSLKDVTKSLKEKTPFVPVVEGETEEDRYRLLEQKVAEVDFESQTPRGKAFAAAAAILHPQMVRTISKLQAEIETLRSRVKGENASRASVSPSDQSKAPSSEPQDFLTAMGVPTNPTMSQSLM